MHISSCLHPVLVKNKYLPDSQQWQYVACGKCAACTMNHSLNWVQRLTNERRCWKYMVFFTLTYAEKYLPTLTCENDVIFDTSISHVNPEYGTIHFTFDDVKPKEEDLVWLRNNNNKLPYLSVYDVQKFIKRLRRNLQYKAQQENEYNKKYNVSADKILPQDYHVRYFLCGEMGETTVRPHYHGLLFFSSRWQAKNIKEAIYKSWKFGIVDFSFAREASIQYVAKYVNCTANLPSFYEYKRIKPFSIFSKQPPIGTLIYDEQEIKELFFSGAPDFAVRSIKGNSFDNVPLWRTYIGRLYPKVSGFGEFSHFNRVALYRAAETSQCEEWKEFLEFCKFHCFTRGFLNDYIDCITDNLTNLGPLQRWWMISRRVCEQSYTWNIDVDYYVRCIEKFYENIDYEKLKKMLTFEEDWTKEHDNSALLSFDPIFFDLVRDSTKYSSFEDFMFTYGDTLIMYDIDPERFYNDENYQKSLMYNSNIDYVIMQIDYEKILKDSCKTKKKNDYLLAHPEARRKVFQ